MSQSYDRVFANLARLYALHPEWFDFDYANHLQSSIRNVRKAARALSLPIRYTNRKIVRGKVIVPTTVAVVLMDQAAKDRGLSYGNYVAMLEHPVTVRGYSGITIAKEEKT